MAYAPLQAGYGTLGKLKGLDPRWREQAERDADLFIERHFSSYDTSKWSNGRAPLQVQSIARKVGEAEYLRLSSVSRDPFAGTPETTKDLMAAAKLSVQEALASGQLKLPDGSLQIPKGRSQGLTRGVFR